MDYEIDPNCEKCGGTGSVVWSEKDPLSYVPCGACMQRYEATHCAICDARVELDRLPWRAEHVVGGRVLRTTRVCSNGCALVVVARHGHVDIVPPEAIHDE